MKVELPRRVFDLLTAPQMAVANAMANRHRAKMWMVRARGQDRLLKEMYVAFARSAHRAYLNDLKRLKQFSRHPGIYLRRQAG